MDARGDRPWHRKIGDRLCATALQGPQRPRFVNASPAGMMETGVEATFAAARRLARNAKRRAGGDENERRAIDQGISDGRRHKSDDGADTRWRFTDITPDSFRWTGERSTDGQASLSAGGVPVSSPNLTALDQTKRSACANSIWPDLTRRDF
jgi:hypothetical protein